jgi:hypothetical protein
MNHPSNVATLAGLREDFIDMALDCSPIEVGNMYRFICGFGMM